MRRLQITPECAVRTALAEVLLGNRESRSLHRLHAVLLVSQGRSCYEVARWFGDNPRTVERWVHAFDDAGVDGLSCVHRGGRRACLSVDSAQKLRQELAGAPLCAGFAQTRWSGKLLVKHLARNYDIALSQRHCQRLLLRLRASG